MQVTSISSPVYADAGGVTVDCVVTIEGLGTIPYSARSDDDTAHGQEIWAALQAMQIVPYEPPAVSPADLRAHLAVIGRATEAAGITVAGMQIQTDRESQALITGAWALVQVEPERVIDFITDTGPVQLDAVSMTAVAVAVAGHVQRAFSARATVLAQISSGAVTTISGVETSFAAAMEGEDAEF